MSRFNRLSSDVPKSCREGCVGQISSRVCMDVWGAPTRTLATEELVAKRPRFQAQAGKFLETPASGTSPNYSWGAGRGCSAPGRGTENS